MATHTFDISYIQDNNPNTNGDIVFNNNTITADGRLDIVGAAVTATGFTIANVPNCSTLTVTVTCTRTANTKMDVLVQLGGSCIGVGGYNYGYDPVNFEKFIENVDITL